jgi:hypothetical protein
MCYFDSPVGRCEIVREMVLLDQTQADCAREHACRRTQKCPLRACFAEPAAPSSLRRAPARTRGRAAAD